MLKIKTGQYDPEDNRRAQFRSTHSKADELIDTSKQSQDETDSIPTNDGHTFVCDTRTSLDHTLAQIRFQPRRQRQMSDRRSPYIEINLGYPPLFSPGSVCQVGQDATYIPQSEPAHDKIHTIFIVLTRGEMPFKSAALLIFRYRKLTVPTVQQPPPRWTKSINSAPG
ncbi:conserved hypothetical protein, partial [Trichinella spiralis]|uniref:hypothetical protein n=1 Tax=Trichinella spiralis TaxID=6334 RepID=UPI0001EFE257